MRWAAPIALASTGFYAGLFAAITHNAGLLGTCLVLCLIGMCGLRDVE